MNPALEAEISQLSQQEKLTLVGKIWAMIDADELPVPVEVMTELDRRWAEHVRNPGAALTLDALMARVEAKRR
jgi:putative addiction module component (TIGR02574 family)